jgi:hypothetical protein
MHFKCTFQCKENIKIKIIFEKKIERKYTALKIAVNWIWTAYENECESGNLCIHSLSEIESSEFNFYRDCLIYDRTKWRMFANILSQLFFVIYKNNVALAVKLFVRKKETIFYKISCRRSVVVYWRRLIFLRNYNLICSCE